MAGGRAPSVQYLRTKEDLKNIVFTDGMAAVEAPLKLLSKIKFKNHRRLLSPRLRRLERAIRDHGYDPTQPIICRIGQKGRWIVVDGGHRLTAVKRISGSFWSRFFTPNIRTLYFLLYETPRSWTKLKRRKEDANRDALAPSAEQPTPEAETRTSAEPSTSEEPTES